MQQMLKLMAAHWICAALYFRRLGYDLPGICPSLRLFVCLLETLCTNHLY